MMGKRRDNSGSIREASIGVKATLIDAMNLAVRGAKVNNLEPHHVHGGPVGKELETHEGAWKAA
jgi:hypothetical protein